MDGDSDEKKTESKLHVEYKIPSWFLTYNVKTAAELIESETSIHFTTGEENGQADKLNPPTTIPTVVHGDLATASTSHCDQSLVQEKSGESSSLQDGPESEFSKGNDEKGTSERNECKYELQHDKYLEIRDMTAGVLYCGHISEEDHRQQPSILLQTPVAEAIYSLESVIEHVARELGADLISVDREDLADVALEFSRQGEEKQTGAPSLDDLTQVYFSFSKKKDKDADLERNRKAVSAILDAPRLKTKTRQSSNKSSGQESSASSPPVLLHIRNARKIGSLKNGTKILKTFRARVQDCREKNESVILFATIFSDKPASDYAGWEMEKFRRKLSVDQASIIEITPPGNEVILARNHAHYTQEVNLRRLKRILRQKLRSNFCSDLLAPRPSWDPSKLKPVSAILGESEWSEFTLKRAARQIIGRAWGKSELELDDICEVIVRVDQNAETISRWKKAKEAKPSPAEEKPSDFKEKLEELERRCDSYESELLSCVVNPENLQVTFEDVIVDQEVKDTVKQMISLSNFRPKNISHGLLRLIQMSGALLYGPPGTGKTHLSRAIAKDLGVNMLAITSADIVSKWVGDTDRYIKAAFSLSVKLAPCVLFIDEVDSLFFSRSSHDRRYERSAINLFLQEMDGLATSENAPFVLVATNRPMDLDEAFLRRLPQKVLFTLPSEHERCQILKTFLKKQDIGPQVSIEELAKKTKGFSGSDLRTFCGHAALIFKMEQVRAQPTLTVAAPAARLVLEPHHFEKAHQRTIPSVSKRMLEEIEDFTRSHKPQTWSDIQTDIVPASPGNAYSLDLAHRKSRGSRHAVFRRIRFWS